MFFSSIELISLFVKQLFYYDTKSSRQAPRVLNLLTVSEYLVIMLDKKERMYEN